MRPGSVPSFTVCRLQSLVLSESDALVAPLSSGGGGERAAARSANHSAGRLERTSARSVGERALPGDIETPPHLTPPLPTFCISNCTNFLFSFYIHSLCYHLSLSALTPPSPAPSPSCLQAIKNKPSLRSPAAPATWRPLNVHVSNGCCRSAAA